MDKTTENKQKSWEYGTTLEHIDGLLKAFIPYVWVITHEEKRFLKTLFIEIAEKRNKELWTWSAYQGIIRYDVNESHKRASGDMDKTWQPHVALEAIEKYKYPDNKKGAIFVMKDFHTVLAQPIPRIMRDLYQSLIQQQKTLIIISSSLSHGASGSKSGIEPTLDKQITVVRYDLPKREEVETRIRTCVKHMYEGNKGKQIATQLVYTDEEYNKFAMALQGLTELEIDNAVIGSLCHLQKIDERKLLNEKKQIIQRSDILEYVGQTTKMDDVGGLDLAKQYFDAYSDQFSPEAREYGVDPLKGVLLVGVPGCLDGDTPIYDPVTNETKTIQERYKEGRFFNVISKNENGEEVVAVGCPPKKYKPTNMLKLTDNSGNEITVTHQHRFLGIDGWIYASEVANKVNQDGYVFLETSLSTCQQAQQQDVDHLNQKIQDSQSDIGQQLLVFSHQSNEPSVYSWFNNTRYSRIVKVEDAGVKEYYDFHVPIYNNYSACGFWNHNCGKSLISRAISNMWSLPLLTLDIGRVMSGLVGSSEQRMREAISQVEAIAPCILRVDEIEKSLSGTKSSGQTDGGTLSRVFGTFLTAMEEGMKDVVVIACVDGKTVIQLSNGQMCLAENMITENKLLSTDFNTGELVTTNPSFRTNPTTNILYTVNTTTSRISCSHNHPFFSIDINGNINEVAAENLSKGMFLAAPLIIPEPEDTSLRILESVEKTHGNQKNINLPSILNEDLSYLVGYTTGDGGKSGRPGQNFPDRISWNDCNKGMINTIKNLSEDLFKVNCNIYENIRESSNVTYYAYIDSNILGEWFSKHFSDSIRARGPNRQVPLEIQKSNNSIVANYLSGIFDAEGWVQGEDNKFQIGWVTTSYILVQQISMLFRRFGIYPTLSSGFSKSSFTKNMIYRLHISSYEQQKLFYKYINFRHPDKKEKLENFLSTFNPQKSMGYYATNIPVPTELVLKLTKKYGIQQKRLDNFIQTKFASKTHIPTVTRSLFNKWINVLSEYIIDRDEDFEKLKILSKYQWDRVKDVTFTEGETKVYDFHIPELHNYIASGLIVHNTANDISALPPELIRRFNEVLFVDLPQPEEREEIFKIHLAKRKRDMSKLKLDVNKIVAATHLFTGSEIEKVVKESIARAFRQKKKDVTTKIILNVCNETKPIATIMKEKIDAIREWARNRARYASSLAAAANAPGAQHVTTKSGKELDLSDDLDDLDEAVKTSKEEKVKNNNEFAQFNGILEE